MRLLLSLVARFLRPLSYEPGALVLAAAVCGAAAVLETSRVTHKHAQKTGRSRAATTARRTANFIQLLKTWSDGVMQSSICLEDVDEGAPKCRTVSTERDGQPPASEPPPVTANFEPPPDPPKSERPSIGAAADVLPAAQNMATPASRPCRARR